MKLYIVVAICNCGGEHAYNLGVFSSRDRAEEVLEKECLNDQTSRVLIEEAKLDVLIEPEVIEGSLAGEILALNPPGEHQN